MTSDPGLQPQRTALAWQRTGLGDVTNLRYNQFRRTPARPPGSRRRFDPRRCCLQRGLRRFPKGTNRRIGVGSMWPTMVAIATLAVITSLACCALAISRM